MADFNNNRLEFVNEEGLRTFWSNVKRYYSNDDNEIVISKNTGFSSDQSLTEYSNKVATTKFVRDNIYDALGKKGKQVIDFHETFEEGIRYEGTSLAYPDYDRFYYHNGKFYNHRIGDDFYEEVFDVNITHTEGNLYQGFSMSDSSITGCYYFNGTWFAPSTPGFALVPVKEILVNGENVVGTLNSDNEDETDPYASYKFRANITVPTGDTLNETLGIESSVDEINKLVGVTDNVQTQIDNLSERVTNEKTEIYGGAESTVTFKSVVDSIDAETTRATEQETILSTLYTEQQEALEEIGDVYNVLVSDASVEGSVDNRISVEIAKVIASAPEEFNTLKKIADYIAEDKEVTEEFSSLFAAINAKIGDFTRGTVESTGICKVIEDEIVRAKAKETSLETAISAEVTRAKARENEIEGEIPTQSSDIGALAEATFNTWKTGFEASKGASGGLATLGANGIILDSQLPVTARETSVYVYDALLPENEEDIEEGKNYAPPVGGQGLIYITLDDDKVWNWQKATSKYAEIGGIDKALRESVTAHLKDRQNPHNVTRFNIGISTAGTIIEDISADSTTASLVKNVNILNQETRKYEVQSKPIISYVDLKKALNLDKVANTTDADKPISDAVREALAEKISTEDIIDSLDVPSTDSPLSANQGVVLNGMMHTLEQRYEGLTGAFTFCGSVSAVTALPTTGVSVGDVYSIPVETTDDDGDKVKNDICYAWNGSEWVSLGNIFNITKYLVTPEDIDAIIDEYQIGG